MSVLPGRLEGGVEQRQCLAGPGWAWLAQHLLSPADQQLADPGLGITFSPE